MEDKQNLGTWAKVLEAFKNEDFSNTTLRCAYNRLRPYNWMLPEGERIEFSDNENICGLYESLARMEAKLLEMAKKEKEHEKLS
jgi:hypothetical protein